MTLVSTSRWELGKRPGKQNGTCFCVRGSMVPSKGALRGRVRWTPLRPVAQAGNRGSGTLPMPKAAESPLPYAFCCFPPASPAFLSGTGKQKTVPNDRSKQLPSLRKFGAGEGIRTLDPNLGKVETGILLGVTTIRPNATGLLKSRKILG
jgi:hypothetical protein